MKCETCEFWTRNKKTDYGLCSKIQNDDKPTKKALAVVKSHGYDSADLLTQADFHCACYSERKQIEIEFHNVDVKRRQKVLVTHDPKGGVDLKITELDGTTHCPSWFLSPEAAKAIHSAIERYYGL